MVAKGGAVVGRTVINQDDFKIGVFLVNNRSDTFVQIFLDVIDRNDDGNQRFHQLKAKYRENHE